MFRSVKKNGLKLNRSKSQFNKSEVYILMIEKQKLSKIYRFRKTKKELQRFLGMLNYLGKFAPNLPENTENLRKRLEMDTERYFDENQVKQT